MLAVEQIKGRCDDVVMQRRRVGEPQYSNRASQIGHPCLRKLYYDRAEWQQRAPWPIDTLRRFREGERHEALAIADLSEAGYRWTHGQQPGFFADLSLSCKMEGYLEDTATGERILAEIKSMDPHPWAQATTLDFLRGSLFYSGYLYQLTTYMRAVNESEALFVFRNRSSGEMRFLPYEFSKDIWADIERKCKLVNNALLKSEAPERIDLSERKEVCSFCPFSHVCLPDVTNPKGGIRFLSDAPKLEGMIDRMTELKELAAEHGTVKEAVRDLVRGLDGVVCGKYLLEGKEDKAGRWRGSIKPLVDERGKENG
jgi:hypothetical protein